MAKTLVIVESPAKAKTIGKYLGKEYEVLASVGHVRDLPKSNKNAIDIPAGFIPCYVITPEKRSVIDAIKRAAAKADTVLLATDPDREGEAIAWHIKEAVGLKKPKRVVFHEITEKAVKEAIAHPRDIDEKLREAQEARRVLDRLVGYDLSGLIWKKVRYGLSAGRVQSPALRILMERERDIRAFVPEAYFPITATFSKEKESFPAVLDETPKNEEEAKRIVSRAPNAKWHVQGVEERKEKRSAKAPFTTSTLQQSASSRLGFAPSRTMRAAQKLYEAGHITYMRTDSTNLSKDAVQEALSIITETFGKEFAEAHTFKTKSKNAQEAHEAIRPTSFRTKRAGNTSDEERLYELIYTRTLASQMTSAILVRTKVTIKSTDDALPTCSTSGSRILFEGWLAVDTKARGEDVEVPHIAEGDSLLLDDIGYESKETEPPKRYSDAGLIRELEKRGIGRPSTYASIVKTIIDRGYVERQGRTMVPTATGDVVSSFIEQHFPTYVSDSFTAEMEDELDDIANGTRSYRKTLEDFYTPFSKEVASKEDLPKATDLGKAPKEFLCPKCGSHMVYKLGRGGIFMSCETYPDCDGARKEDGGELGGEEPLGTHPDTGMPIFVKDGRYGPYVEMPLALPETEEVRDRKEDAVTKTKGEKKVAKKPKKKKIEARRASLPAGVLPENVTIEDAVKYLSLPRELGAHPDDGEIISASAGRFGPYVVHAGEYRSIKAPDDVYTITLPRALELFAIPKQPPRGTEIVRDLGKHPKTGKSVVLYKSKQGMFLKKGLRRIYIPENTNPETLTPEDAVNLIKES